MAFDPDAYLAEKEGDFDPDAYLQSKGEGVTEVTDEEGLTPTGVAETAGAMLSGALAEPVAGIAGLASLPFVGSEAGDVVRRVREALTYTPKTPEGQATIQALAKQLEPITSAIESAEASAGEAGYERFGPVGGAIGETLPTLAGELVGVGLARSAARPVRAIGKDIPAEQASLIAAAEQAGVPLMTSDVIQPETFVGKSIQQSAEKIPLVGTGPVREAQQGLRQRAVEGLANRYGEYSYDTIVNSLKTKKDAIRSAAGTVLEETGNKIDSAVDSVPVSRTLEAIKSASSSLSKPNVIGSSRAADEIDNLLEAISQPQTFSTLKENRTAFRDILESSDPAIRSQLRSRGKAQMQRVYDAMTSDLKQVARENLTPQEFSKWEKANAVWANEAKELTRSKLKNVLDKGDITPEAVDSMLFSRKPSEQKLLYQSLTKSGRDNARAAIISRVVDNVSRRKGGLTPNALETELRKYDSQINTFFKGDEKRQLKGLQRVLEATYRAQEAGVTTPTGQALIPLLTGASVVTNPAATAGVAGTIGGLARLYESASVRNALLKLGSVDPKSGSYAQALLNAQLALTAAMQPESAVEKTETERQQ